MFVVRRPFGQRNARRLFSSARASVALSLSHLSHQSHVHFQASDVACTTVDVVPVLSSDDFALRIVTPDKFMDIEQMFTIEEGRVRNAMQATSVHIAKKGKEDAHVQLLVPYTAALNVAIANGRVRVQDKIEGDVKVVVGRGDIEVDKVRGTAVTLKTNGGKIDVLTLVEGETVSLEATESVACQRLMAERAEVKLGKGEASCSTFGAIYASTCSIVSTNPSNRSNLRLGNVHGYLRVSSEGLDSVEVDSVTGAIDVEDTGPSCNVVAHFDSWTTQVANSILVGGNVQVSLEPAASIDVELHGVQVHIGQDCAFESSVTDQLDHDYVVFTGELCAQETAKDGAARSTGKINVDSAKVDAMRTSFFIKESGEQDETKVQRPRLVVHSLNGQVTLNQLNWMDKIKRKHLKK